MTEWLSIALRLREFEYKAKPVRAMVIRDAGTVVIDGVEYTLQKGVEIELPRWSISLLENQGLVNKAEPELTLDDITRVHFATMSARSPADLEPLPKDFYMNAIEYIHSLKERIRREFDAALLEEQQRAIQYLLEIMDRRLLLILQSVRSPAALAEISSKLSPEESLLLDELRRDLEEWRQKLNPERARD